MVAKGWAGADFRGAPGNFCFIMLIVEVVTRSYTFVKTLELYPKKGDFYCV